ncbi:hypothetical protein CALVIDRAFT_213921 [Calocera viscosa TUFC12733]|uniref:Uncharacterized protein n=1 Tax=Calocera viscosa (strain TUFC12733) TaxID=1330018 RepID=A0A167RDW0_CALVF|nr:hypothetical protein CALVIDRAFT_213921 [Calocera viscosa TUFC12733]
MSTSIIPYNVTLGSESPLFSYSPVRDGPATQGWNASYSGSTAYVPGADGVGTAFRHTENDGASFSVQFVGTAYWLCVSANGGTTYNFTENGHSLPTSGLPADSACSQWPGAKAIVGAGNQTYKSYTVGINITSIPNADASFDFYGAVLELSAGSTGMTTTPVTIDDTNPGWNYQPSPWLQADNPLDYNGTYSYSCTYDVGATATYTFNETTAVQLIGSPNDNTFGYSISFQGVESVYNATNLWHAYKQVLFMAGALDPSTTYSLTLSNYDPNQPDGPGIAGEQACTNLDALILMKIPSATSGNPGSSSSSVGSSPTSPSDQGGSSTSSLSSGAIAGVAIGAVAGVVIIILLLWLFLRRRAKATSIVPEPYPPMEETVDLVSPTTGLPAAMATSTDLVRWIRHQS